MNTQVLEYFSSASDIMEAVIGCFYFLWYECKVAWFNFYCCEVGQQARSNRLAFRVLTQGSRNQKRGGGTYLQVLADHRLEEKAEDLWFLVKFNERHRMLISNSSFLKLWSKLLPLVDLFLLLLWLPPLCSVRPDVVDGTSHSLNTMGKKSWTLTKIFLMIPTS